MHQDFAVPAQIGPAAAQKSGKRKLFQLLGQLRPGAAGINKRKISFFRCFFNASSALCGISFVISLSNVPSISKNNAFTKISSSCTVSCSLSDIRKNAEALDCQGFRHFHSSRSDGIRTHDLCVPNAALYQTEPRFVNASAIILIKSQFVNRFFQIFLIFSNIFF